MSYRIRQNEEADDHGLVALSYWKLIIAGYELVTGVAGTAPTPMITSIPN